MDAVPPESVKRCIHVSAPGKVILFGEHSVVYNKLAIAASLGLRTQIKLQQIEENCFYLTLPALDLYLKYNLDDLNGLISHPLNLQADRSTEDYNFTTPELLDFAAQVKQIKKFISLNLPAKTLSDKEENGLCALFYLIWGILGSFHVKLKPFKLDITTNLRIGAGTGSSASFSVCTAGALLKFIQVEGLRVREGYKKWGGFSAQASDGFDAEMLDLISRWGYECERILHGTPSGIDNTVCTFGSFVEFYKGEPVKLIRIAKEFKLILINSNVARDTKRMVGIVRDLKSDYASVVDGILDGMNAVAQDAIECIKTIDGSEDEAVGSKNYKRLSDLSRINHNLLNGLGVGHVKLDEICLILSKYGLNGKLTGAGGGGYAICLVEPDQCGRIDAVLHDLKCAGFSDCIFTDLGGTGVQLDYLK